MASRADQRIAADPPVSPKLPEWFGYAIEKIPIHAVPTVTVQAVTCHPTWCRALIPAPPRIANGNAACIGQWLKPALMSSLGYRPARALETIVTENQMSGAVATTVSTRVGMSIRLASLT